MTCFMCSFETTTRTCKNSSCQPCIAVEKVDEEINEVVSTLRRLLATRRDFRSKQNRVHDPMSRLPIELRNYISELLLPMRDEWGRIVQVGMIKKFVMPTRLASICKSWHETASSNPLLWSTMELVIGGRIRRPISTSSQIHVLRDWILRSQSLPLTLYIEAHDGDGLEEELNGILDAISQSSTRWFSLFLDMPHEILCNFHHSNFPYHHLKKLRISSSPDDGQNQPVPLLNPKVSPEEIDIAGVSFRWLQISWNHLTSATVHSFGCADVMQLFQHALQMTSCWIFMPCKFTVGSLSTSSITHQNLEVLGLFNASKAEATSILGCLTLPCLQELHTNQLVLLTPAILPALVDRSSCPLTSITLSDVRMDESEILVDMQPFPGVTDIVVETMSYLAFKKLFLEEYFPDLLYLTLRLQPFLHLWDKGVIPALLDRNRARLDAQRRCKLLVVDRHRAFRRNSMWTSDFKKELKEFDVRWRKNGFEFL